MGDDGSGDGGGGDGVSGCGVLLYWVSGITLTSEDRFTLAREPRVSPRTCCNLGTRLSKRPSYQLGSQVVASLSVSSSSSIRDPTIGVDIANKPRPFIRTLREFIKPRGPSPCPMVPVPWPRGPVVLVPWPCSPGPLVTVP